MLTSFPLEFNAFCSSGRYKPEHVSMNNVITDDMVNSLITTIIYFSELINCHRFGFSESAVFK